jgi:hypothetical protein
LFSSLGHLSSFNQHLPGTCYLSCNNKKKREKQKQGKHEDGSQKKRTFRDLQVSLLTCAWSSVDSHKQQRENHWEIIHSGKGIKKPSLQTEPKESEDHGRSSLHEVLVAQISE